MQFTADYPRDVTVHALFERQAAQTPDAIAAVLGDQAISYGELDRRAERLARSLWRLGVGPGTPVALLVERSLAALVGFLGILKAGGAYVPLDPSYPEERITLMLCEIVAPVLLLPRGIPCPEMFPGQVVVLDEIVDLDEAPRTERVGREAPVVVRPRAAVADDIAYVMFTSGSTGQPKAVAIPHRAIVRLVIGTNYITLGPTDRVMHASNLSFDASTFEIWGALLNGARVVVFPKQALLSASTFQAAVQDARITAMFVTTALFHHLADAAPDAFRGVTTLLVGGEVLDPKWARALFAAGSAGGAGGAGGGGGGGGPGRLLNVYGPTEGTTFSTAHLLREPPPDGVRIPIGVAISGTTTHVLDASLVEAPVGEPGELYVGGDGLALGYLNQPGFTAERFIPDPFRAEPGTRLYRTGDRACLLPDGSIDFLGRHDRQVKIRGFRIEPGEVEAALLTFPTVREAVVLVREDAPGDRRLVAYVVTDTDVTGLRAHLDAQLPGHMVPSHLMVLRALPLTPNGKVDHAALPPPGLAGERPSSPNSIGFATRTEAQLAALWTELLRVEVTRRDDSFRDLGGDSLLAARLILRIHKDFAVDLPVQHLFAASPTLARIARLVDALRSGYHNPTEPPQSHALGADAALAPDIRPVAPPSSRGRAPEHLLLTGATGFLGAFLLRDLLLRTEAKVHCLVRALSVSDAARRIQATLSKYELWSPRFRERIVAVPGDLERPRLGLSEDAYDALAAQIEAIYHSAAAVSYVKPYLEHRDANVVGLQEMLRLACATRTKPFHHVSSISVFGHMGYSAGSAIVGEDDAPDPRADQVGTDMGYAQSKWVSEKLVSAAAERGLPTTIFRPGFILGDSATGAGNQDDFMARLLKGCLQIGCFPDLPHHHMSFVPVDYVSAAITRISLDPDAWGKAYHLVPPASQSSDLRSFFDVLGSAGHPLRRLSYTEWLVQLLTALEHSPDNPLLPLVPMLTEQIHEGFTRLELGGRTAHYGDANTRRMLTGTGIACPPLDVALLRTYLDYHRRMGFLPSDRPSERRSTPGSERTPALLSSSPR
ncbi:amino acid adenylation domain-containing protein [Chondromyces apiculatus]|uniref:Long-chain-fatty-acid--CoA ligase n=1 Tax=Chondromyces apiculatus DSM 436 TaxID=1192034 RepID=A0A017T887_9BACT|nr:amino acid adenylation domain-containing protein [Chondromyces apiculatus]EYF05177.1 Long-chain-fatty-acid--CoA ligase [Chondromyces apiculatus DSM 436]